jgi:hypothetical protein
MALSTRALRLEHVVDDDRRKQLDPLGIARNEHADPERRETEPLEHGAHGGG